MRGKGINDLREHFSYDPEAGVFRWLKAVPRGKRKVGGIAGTPHGPAGYYQLSLFKRRIYAHRAAWAMHYGEWPPGDIDHINRDRSDNRICNLRICNDSTNGANRGVPANNTSGVKGVSWNRKSSSWQASIKVRGRQIHLGFFDAIEDAARAYRDRAVKEFGEFAFTEGHDEV